MRYYIYEGEQEVWIEGVDEYMELPDHSFVSWNAINPPDCVKKVDLLYTTNYKMAMPFKTRKEAEVYVKFLKDDVARLDYLVVDEATAKEIDDERR